MRDLIPFFFKNDCLFILDQRKLPFKKIYICCKTYRDVIKCIKNMSVRGAPSIGIVAGYGLILALKKDVKNLYDYIIKVSQEILISRPTAYNLFYVLDRIKKFIFKNIKLPKEEIFKKAILEMNLIEKENYYSMLKISKLGANLISNESVILTHCNTGALACGKIGTALGIIIEAYRQKKVRNVYVDETRPNLQGAKLTILELYLNKVPCVLITDNMAAFVIKNKMVNYIIVGADRIAANGDTANKIGSLNLAILANYYKIPFYVAAPFSTIDKNISCGEDIEIEYRNEDEIKKINNKYITVRNTKVFNPSFDITPSNLISFIITDKGIYKYPYNFK